MEDKIRNGKTKMKMLREKTENTNLIEEWHLFPMKKWNKILETVVKQMSEENFPQLKNV